MSSPIDSGRTPGPLADRGLRLERVSKTFSGRRVLNDFAVTIAPGEVHGLVGQNGSGKSTLIKILAGFHKPDQGAGAWLDGAPFPLGTIPATVGVPLRFVHQDLALILQLNAVDNVALGGGYSKRWRGVINWDMQARATHKALQEFGISVDLEAPVARLSPVERTAIAIVRALAGWDGGSGVLVLDEPTASLPSVEVAKLHEIVHGVAARGASVVYVSHRLDDVLSVADRISILRDGDLVGTVAVEGLDTVQLAELMVGRTVQKRRSEERLPGGPEVLCATDIHTRELHGVSLSVAKGEILGIAGVLGSGREELPYVLAGAYAGDCAALVQVDGHTVDPHSPRSAQRLGVGLVPAERSAEAAFAPMTMSENLTASTLPRLARHGVLSTAVEENVVSEWVQNLNVVPPTASLPFPKFSGGNQQKVVLARVLNQRPKVLVMAEPTAGVDIGAREAIYESIRAEVRARDLAVVVASSDVQDLVSMCHRVIVLQAGRVVAQFEGALIDESTIVHAAEVSMADPDAKGPRHT